jgi:hypothetical protein
MIRGNHNIKIKKICRVKKKRVTIYQVNWTKGV